MARVKVIKYDVYFTKENLSNEAYNPLTTFRVYGASASEIGSGITSWINALTSNESLISISVIQHPEWVESGT